MGQSRIARSGRAPVAGAADVPQSGRLEEPNDNRLCLSVFLTDLGWFGLLGRDGRVRGLTIGHVRPDSVRAALAKKHPVSNGGDLPELPECDWYPELRRRLERYAEGHPADFNEFALELPHGTPFQQRVVRVTRTIPYGRTLTYGDLAAKAGSPRAARAVGNTMAANTVPILIPCHRVVASGGRPGGFSAPQGISLKQRMLAMEAETGGEDHETVCISAGARSCGSPPSGEAATRSKRAGNPRPGA